MTCMTLTLLGNYAQTGHFGGPLAYTPYNVAVHLAGPKLGGLRHDYRRPKHPYGDKFMLAAGHCAPTCYALWMIMGEALLPEVQGDRRQEVLRRAEGRLSRDRRARLPARRRRAEDAAAGSGARRRPALRGGERRGARHPRALGAHRIDRSEQRRERRAVGRRPFVGRGQGGVLGHGRRAGRAAESDRVRR